MWMLTFLYGYKLSNPTGNFQASQSFIHENHRGEFSNEGEQMKTKRVGLKIYSGEIGQALILINKR